MRRNGVPDLTVEPKRKAYLALTRSRHPSVDGDLALKLDTPAASLAYQI